MALTATLSNGGVYRPGDTMTMTVKVAAGERNQDVDYPASASVPGLGSVSVNIHVDKDPLPVTLVDPAHVWTKISDDEVTAVYTATA